MGMRYGTLGKTGLRVSSIGLGTGGSSRLGQSTGRSAAQSRDVVRTALDLGINLLDSAPIYGESEVLLGEALKGVPRDSYILTTKFRPRLTNPGKGTLAEDPEDLTRSLDASLQRLNVDMVDVFMLHDVRPVNYREIIDRFYPPIKRAQEAGKLRFVGITESRIRDQRHEMLEEAVASDLFDVIMVKYGLLNQTAEERVFPLVQEHNVSVLVMSSVRTSLRNPEETVERLSKFIDEGLLQIDKPSVEDPLGLGSIGEPVPGVRETAYLFASRHPAVSTLLVGTGNAEHLKANVADILGSSLSDAQMSYLRQTFGGLAWGE